MRTFVPALFLFLGCTAPALSPDEFRIHPEREFSIEEVLGSEHGEMGCRKMLDSYCTSLHSPGAQGNILVGRGPSSTLVLQGRTRNDFTSAYYLYSTAKLRARNALPSDFRQVLESQRYFELLVRSLNRSPRSQMGLESRATSLRRDYELDRIWSAAISETVLRRMNARFPGFHRLRDNLVPIEQSVERTRMRKGLISEVSRAIWKKDANWSKVQASFEKLRTKFLSLIDTLDIPPAVRDAWIQRISSVELVIPGAIPAIADSECSTTQVNAFYYSHLNLITVCAGDFNGEDILQTVAHELAHSLDINRSIYQYQKDSALGRSLAGLRREVCAPKSFSCESWRAFKSALPKQTQELTGYRTELPEFQRCLKRRTTSKPLRQEEIRRFAEKEISDQVSNLARTGVFLRITKESVPLANGKPAKNPNFLNPCGYKVFSHGEEPIDDDLSQLLFFTAEYRCNPQLDPKTRLGHAIETSRAMATEISAASIAMEGEFSPREDLGAEGFSSSPAERFADVLGSYAFASLLSERKDLSERRHTFLASSSWQCDKPSLESLYPEENSVQQAFVFDPHSETDTRKKEMFTRPIRSALGCKEDFDFKGCELGFRPSGKNGN